MLDKKKRFVFRLREMFLVKLLDDNPKMIVIISKLNQKKLSHSQFPQIFLSVTILLSLIQSQIIFIQAIYFMEITRINLLRRILFIVIFIMIPLKILHFNAFFVNAIIFSNKRLLFFLKKCFIR